MENEKKETSLSKVLGPMHIWALGVGIVLVGEFMGWNYTVAKGGSLGSLIALWTVAIFYIMIVMMNTEMGSVMPEAGGQYTMAKYLLGPLAAFNVGLMLVFEYAMLEAADVLVAEGAPALLRNVWAQPGHQGGAQLQHPGAGQPLPDGEQGGQPRLPVGVLQQGQRGLSVGEGDQPPGSQGLGDLAVDLTDQLVVHREATFPVPVGQGG